MAEEMHRHLSAVIFPGHIHGHTMPYAELPHGHITPFVELAKSLAIHGLKIFIVSTALNIKRIKPEVSDRAGIELVELAMPAVQRLPTGIESSAVLLPLLTVAMDQLEKPFEELLQKLSPDFVMYDCLQHWVPRVAAKMHNLVVPILFLPSGAASFSFLQGHHGVTSGNPSVEDLTVSPPGFPSPNIHLTLFEARRATELMYCKRDRGLRVAERSSVSMRESWAVACNTCLEVEGVYVEYLQSLVKRPVFPVGILVPELSPPSVDDICLQWLDRQPDASVVVLSFGSECVFTRQQLDAIAMGLRESNAPFLWFLPAGNELPQGFRDQLGEKGLMVTKWVPESHILNHVSVGALLTHCGWSSMTTSLRFGVPLITLPIKFEEGLNAKLVQGLKMGVGVSRDEDNGYFTTKDIANAIKVVMIEEGEQIKSNVTKVSDMLKRNNFGVSERNMINFVSILKAFNK